MLVRVLTAICVLTSASAFAYTEPERPVFDESIVTPLFKRAAYAAFIGDACSINHSIPDQIRKTAKIVYSDPQKQQEQVSFFSSRKSHFASDASTIGILKRCNLESGKTRALVNDVGRELEDINQSYSSKLSAYQTAYSQWQQDVAREQEAAAQRETERIRSIALSLSDQLGKLIVQNAYQGGQSVSVKLVNYEYIESTRTMRMKVELRWNGAMSGESGYAADGEIVATYDNSPSWDFGRNYRWNSSWQSAKLDEWISKRQLIRALDAFSNN
ncbi:hypothetical protein [Vibrio cholerae]